MSLFLYKFGHRLDLKIIENIIKSKLQFQHLVFTVTATAKKEVNSDIQILVLPSLAKVKTLNNPKKKKIGLYICVKIQSKTVCKSRVLPLLINILISKIFFKVKWDCV